MDEVGDVGKLFTQATTTLLATIKKTDPSSGHAGNARTRLILMNLNERDNADMRARHYQDYEGGQVKLSYLKKVSPFIHFEIVRQELEKKGQ